MMQKNIIIQKQAGQISAAEEYENLKVVSLCWATLPRLKKSVVHSRILEC